jgi:CRP-like cAMP-binding protein
MKEKELSIEPLAEVIAQKETLLKVMPKQERDERKSHKIVFQPQLPLSTERLINKLQSNYSFFMDMAKSEINEILFLSKRKTYQPGDQVFSKGDIGDSFYLVIQGEIRILIDPREIQISSGQIFGEMAILGLNTRTATAMAKEKSVVLVITKEILGSHLSSLRCKVSINMARQLTENLQRADKTIQDLTNRLRKAENKVRELEPDSVDGADALKLENYSRPVQESD